MLNVRRLWLWSCVSRVVLLRVTTRGCFLVLVWVLVLVLINVVILVLCLGVVDLTLVFIPILRVILVLGSFYCSS